MLKPDTTVGETSNWKFSWNKEKYIKEVGEQVIDNKARGVLYIKPLPEN